MIENVLVENAEKYRGRYVILKSFWDNKVILDNENPSEILKQAVELGYDDPVIIYVPIGFNKSHEKYIMSHRSGILYR